jgi:cobalt-zinc-cadmium efflux system membrane fusion protein
MMKKLKNTKFNILTKSQTIVAIALILAACSSKTPDVIEITADSVGENPYVLSQLQFQSSGLELGEMKMTAFHEVVNANGVFDVPPEYRASVSSYFGGTVENIQLLTGEKVKKGQVLFTLVNPEFVQMQQDYLEAKGQLTYLASNYERQKNLAQDNVTSQKDFLKSESEYNVNQVKVASLGKKLALMNIDPSNLTLENISSTINITSPVNGYITHVNITTGTLLTPSQVAIEIVNTEHLHLELNIFEKDLAKVQIGQEIQFKTQEANSKEYEGTVYLINRTIDPDHRTIGIHGHLTDEKLTDQFTPGMYIEASIFAKSDSSYALPQEAVVEIEDKYYVLVLESSSNDEYAFSQQEVTTGKRNQDTIEILNAKDFKSNTKFLTKGAFNMIQE